MNNYNQSNNMSCLAASTITAAKNSNLFNEKQINWMEKTKNNVDPSNSIIHRGIETTLFKQSGFLSPSFKDNCSVIHRFDNNPSKVPKY